MRIWSDERSIRQLDGTVMMTEQIDPFKQALADALTRTLNGQENLFKLKKLVDGYIVSQVKTKDMAPSPNGSGA